MFVRREKILWVINISVTELRFDLFVNSEVVLFRYHLKLI